MGWWVIVLWEAFLTQISQNILLGDCQRCYQHSISTHHHHHTKCHTSHYWMITYLYHQFIFYREKMKVEWCKQIFQFSLIGSTLLNIFIYLLISLLFIIISQILILAYIKTKQTSLFNDEKVLWNYEVVDLFKQSSVSQAITTIQPILFI